MLSKHLKIPFNRYRILRLLRYLRENKLIKSISRNKYKQKKFEPEPWNSDKVNSGSPGGSSYLDNAGGSDTEPLTGGGQLADEDASYPPPPSCIQQPQSLPLSEVGFWFLQKWDSLYQKRGQFNDRPSNYKEELPWNKCENYFSLYF